MQPESHPGTESLSGKSISSRALGKEKDLERGIPREMQFAG